MEPWVIRAKELLAVLDEHPTVAIQTSEARDNFREVLDGATKENYIVQHYREPRAVVMNVEAYEAVRRLALLVSSLVGEQERLDRPEEPIEETTMSEAEWEADVKQTIREVRSENRAKSRFKRRTAV